jgi:hypothetical protein
LIEDGRLVGNYISDSGWSIDIETVPDINRNGLDEFVLAFSGGMHQGESGTGVDLMEFNDGLPKGIGWYQAEAFTATGSSTAWKLMATPGKMPVFYRQAYKSGKNDKWFPSGTARVFKLGEAYSTFTAVK